MPIYAYKCESCGHSKDVLQKMSDAQLTVCPQCHAAAFKKQLTSAGFQLKGSGWYVTDFRGGAGAAAGQGSESGASDNGKSAESKPGVTASAAPAAAAPASAVPASTSAAPAPSPSASTTAPAKGGV